MCFDSRGMNVRIVVLAAAMLSGAGIEAVPPQTPAPRLALFDRWVAAVDAHRPGERDAAVEEFAALPGVDREPLMQIAWKFAGFLHDPIGADRREMSNENGTEIGRLRLLAKAALTRTTDANWLHRAAAFHADVMMLAADLTEQADRNAPGHGRSAPGLLNANDGEFHSTGDRNWSLAFGRRLIADVPSPATDDFAGRWYHATSAFLMARRWFGELKPHLAAGERLRPSDPWIHFDQGTLFEALTGSAVQAVLLSTRLPSGVTPDVPRVDVANAEAMKYYRRVLSAGPTFIEARVRYGRLLVESARYDDAMVQFDVAVSTATDPETLFFAHLFALRAEQGRGHVEAAAEHGRAAARLFPTAQSAQIALSQLALSAGDLTAAIAPVETIRAMRTDGLRDDPWWRYFDGAGRSASAIASAAWAALR